MLAPVYKLSKRNKQVEIILPRENIHSFSYKANLHIIFIFLETQSVRTGCHRKI